MSTLDAQQVQVWVGQTCLLHPLALTFARGEFCAIVGPNGAGKSTLLRALLGLVDHGGDVFVAGLKRTAMTPKQRARALAYLPQGQTQAWPLPVRDVVALGRYPHGGGNDDVVDALLHRLDLHALSERSVLTLSGGEQMRVALARALAVEADFLLADEPLASLDPRHQFAILTLLANQAKDGQGVVVVMHDLHLAARYAQRIVVLHEGSVHADGAPADVLNDDVMHHVFGVAGGKRFVEGADGAQHQIVLPDRRLTL